MRQKCALFRRHAPYADAPWPSQEVVVVEIVVALVLAVLAAVLFLVWQRRHGNPGVRDHDPQAHRNVSKHADRPPVLGNGPDVFGGW